MPAPYDISRLRAQRDAALASAVALEDRLRTIETAVARAERAGRRDDAARLQAEKSELETAARGARADYTRLDDDALLGLIGWLDQSPEDIVRACTDAFPFVLVPVRLETKFAKVGTATELRVRFFPDDISTPPPLAAPTDEERSLAVAYWRARARSRQAPGDDAFRRAYRGAWTTLAATAGVHRAGYVVRSTTPVNPDLPPDDLIFADPASVTDPPVARAELLPDRFVVLAYRRDPTTRALSQVGRAVGAAIPDNLTLSPDADQSESWLTRDESTGDLVVPEPLQWVVNFDKAVAAGMAVRLPVTAPFDQIGFDRLIALGVRSATPPEDAPAAVTSLLSKHRFSHGCGLVNAGTPTNNSEFAASGWHTAAHDDEELFVIEDAPPDISVREEVLGTTDGWRLSQLLGLPTEFVRRLPRAASTDIAEALAINTALAPGTLTDFVVEFLRSVVSSQTAAQLERFFTSWVSGRGLYPALSIGRQPYGIVVTSAWGRWAFPPSGETASPESSIAAKLFELMAGHRFRWQVLAERTAHAAQRSVDPFDRLLGIIGLLASSTSFISRKAVSDEYIRQRLSFGGVGDVAASAWFNELRNVREASLAAVDFPAVSSATDPLLAFIVFLRETTDWRLPLVDRDPKVPLSEISAIGPYDGAHNYLWWLTQASRADLTSERFVGADGAILSPPAALLYVLLRHALLAALERGSLDAATRHGAQFFSVVARDPLIANIGREQHIQRRDYLEVDASRLGLTRTPTALADWLLAAARHPADDRPSAAARLAQVQEAIAALASLPTARLERLLGEHVDLCSHRLDAWITAIYLERLSFLQDRTAVPGLHLGAFAWVENLRPSTGRVALGLDALPTALRPAVSGNLFEDSGNGGYVHAPSLTQATTAAVLRNGYLSHASPSEPLPFAVNLSSTRMRAAAALTTGVRAGQSIGALLGYQFERGLHEGHPGIELDRFIGTLRDQFPLLSGRISEIPPGTSTEHVEARNVVDGLALAETTRGLPYPYGIADLPAAGSAEATAIAAEIDRVHDALDAAADLLMAESVHHAVQGNVARTAAAQQALTSPALPPEPEIIRTPRSGRALTFRVTIALDGDATTGWSNTLTPRASANPQLNHWLSRHLPQPDAVQWTVGIGAAAPAPQSLADFGLEPLDLVLMSGDRLGDQSSELERYLMRHFRWRQATDDELTVDFAGGAPGTTSLATLHPLLTRLRRLIGAARASHAADWRRAADAPHAAPGDHTGCATGHPRLEGFADLTDRLDVAKATFESALAELKAALTAIAPLATALEADPATIADPMWGDPLEELRRTLFAMVPFGIPEAVPADGHVVSVSLVDRLTRQGRVVSKIAVDRLARVGELRSNPFSEPLPEGEIERIAETARRNNVLRARYVDAARAIFGSCFELLPLFRFAPDQVGEVEHAIAAPPATTATVEDWLLALARVRPRLADLTWVLAASRWTGHPLPELSAVQFPDRPDVPWIGGAVDGSLPPGEWLSLLVMNAEAAERPLQAGLLLDDWTETVPADRETTGVAFHFDRPNAVAPQALLVAVPPDLRGHWTWDDLVGCVHEALDLAALRAVEPDALLGRNADASPPQGDYFQVLPAILTEFTSGRIATTDFASRVAAVVAQLTP